MSSTHLHQGIFSTWNKEKLCSPGARKFSLPRASTVSPYSKWKIFPGVNVCCSLVLYEISFPNVHKVLRILCKLPITCAECERSFSTLRRLKTYLSTTMTSERESELALMNIHYGWQIDIGATIDLFARKHPRRPLSDILAE